MHNSSLSFFVHLQEGYESQSSFIYKKIMKLFMHTHEGYQLHWIAFLELNHW